MIIYLGLLCLGSTLHAEAWNPAILVGSGWNNHDMVFDAVGTAYLVWWGEGLSFSLNTDNGLHWTAPRNVAPMPPGQHGNPDLAIDAVGLLYAVFEFKPEAAPYYQPYFTLSADGGETWTPAVEIASTPRHSAWPKIEVDSIGRIHVVWHDLCNLHDWDDPPLPGCSGVDLRHMRSDDQGRSWSSPGLITSGSGAWTLHTAVDSAGGIYAFWASGPIEGGPDGVYMHKSEDGGFVWSGTYLGPGMDKAAAIDPNDTVHVLYSAGVGPGRTVLSYRRGERGGRRWSEPAVVAEVTGASPFNPSSWCSVAADGNNLLIAYQSASSGNFEVYYRRSPDGGQSWLGVQNLSSTETPSLQPDIFMDADSVAHLVWNEATPEFEVFYRRGAVADFLNYALGCRPDPVSSDLIGPGCERRLVPSSADPE